MAWRESARLCGVAAVVMGISTLAARPVAAQEIERSLAGIRLGSRSTAVLAKYGNPNYVVIGDVGIRQAPLTAGGGGAAGSSGGYPGAQGGGSLPGLPGSGYPGMGGGESMMGPMGGKPSSMGGMSSASPGGYPGGGGGYPGGGGGYPGAGGGYPGAGGGYPGAGGGDPRASGFPGGSSGGFPGGGSPSGYPGGGEGGAGGAGGFGQTVSSLAHEQEVTWVYNRKVGNNVVSYEFLIGPSGDVSQIRVSGYSGGNARTRRGILLGSTYKDVVRVYGFPEDHTQVGSVLVASYKSRAHVSYQFLTQPGQDSAYTSGNKVIAITIATIE